MVAGDRLARAGLAATLEAEGIRVVGRLDPLDFGDEEWGLLNAYDADVVAADFGGPGADAGRAVERLRTLIEALIGGESGASESMADEDDGPVLVALVDGEVQVGLARSLGARAVLDREISPAALSAAIVAAAAGLFVASPSIADSMTGRRSADHDGLLDPLTPRESEVLTHLALGRSNRQIAATLSISPHTVKDHVDAILAKLGAASRTEAVVRAARIGLITI